MRRRDLISLLGGATAANLWPFAAPAQQAKIPRIGFVWIGSPGNDSTLAGLRQGLADRGYVPGRNLLIDARYAAGDQERIPTLIAELLALGVDILVTPGTPISLAAHKATSTVPIVCVTGDPVGVGLAASLAHPGGNVTGLSLLSGQYSAKWLELLKAAVPKLNRVAILWNPDNAATQNEVRRLDEAARGLGLALTRLSARPQELESSFAAIDAASFDGLIVSDDPSIEPLISRIVALVGSNRVPTIYAFSVAVRQGGLMSYSADFFALWRRAAGYVDRILKGARPGDLPIEQATAISFAVNLKTAKALGLEIPALLLASANEVIE
jgi:putative ABC transport system substrate-binding protein